MKIRTQDGCKYIEFGEAYAVESGTNAVVYIKTRYSREPVFAGIYEDVARARGVLYEIGLSHQKKERIFYMPGV